MSADYTQLLREAIAEGKAAGFESAASELERACFRTAFTTSSELLHEHAAAIGHFLEATRGRLPRAMRAKIAECWRLIGGCMFGKVQLLFLLAPVAITALALASWLVTVWRNPAAGIAAPGYEVLLYSALWSGAVELVAVPVALVRLWRHAELRGSRNIAAIVVGLLPIPVAAVLWLALLLGLG